MVGRWIDQLLGKSRGKSKNVAKERLHLVLTQDRSSLSPELLNTLREEIITVISKYVDIDRDDMEFQLGRKGQAVALMASIPVRKSRTSGNQRRSAGS